MLDLSYSEKRGAMTFEMVGSKPAPANGVDRFTPLVDTDWPSAVFNEIDYGIVLLGDGAQVRFTNVAARIELDHDHPLYLRDSELHAHRADDAALLRAAIAAAASRGLRKLLNLRLAATSAMVSVSIVPLRSPGPEHDRPASPSPGRSRVLVLLGKRRLGGVLAIEAFARSQGLSCGETRVLCALVEGKTPAELAEQHGVAISTVRTQIGNIRAKTGAASIRDLLVQIAALPPLLGVLRSADPADRRFA